MSRLYLLFLGVLLGAIFTRMATREKPASIKQPRRRRAAYQKTKLAKRKIMVFLKERRRVANDDIERLLGVSDATATRYLELLEREDKIIQAGRRGKGVYYKRK